MKYTKIVAKIYNLLFEYEHFEESRCFGCLAPQEMNCEDCTVTQRKEELAEIIVEKIKEEIIGE